jgi:hypothetical protein
MCWIVLHPANSADGCPYSDTGGIRTTFMRLLQVVSTTRRSRRKNPGALQLPISQRCRIFVIFRSRQAMQHLRAHGFAPVTTRPTVLDRWGVVFLGSDVSGMGEIP